MKTNKLLLFLLLLTNTIGFCATITISSTSSSMVFSPSTVTIDFGDVVDFSLASIHDAVEVSESTWNANSSSPLSGGFQVPFGGGSLTDLSVGTHWYVCQNHVGMGMKGKITVTALGVNENQFAKNFSVFPNPTNDIITVKIIDSDFGSTYSVTNVLGKQVLSGQLDELTTTVDLSQLTSGIYFFQVGEYRRQSLKIVKK